MVGVARRSCLAGPKKKHTTMTDRNDGDDDDDEHEHLSIHQLVA